MAKSILLMLTYVFNVIDCALTLHLNKTNSNFFELNPLGRVLIDGGTLALYKVVIVGLFVGVLWYFRENRVAKAGTYICFVVYAALMVWWAIYLIMIK